jgi:uncharacterized protein YcbK (DUF882 family)
MKYHVDFFGIHEFPCPCCGRVKVAAALVFWLDVMRRAIGAPLKINSGVRCASRNASVGGSATSRHLIGCAVDIARPSSVDYDELVNLARRLAGEGNGWEIVTYLSQTYFHFGVPRAHEGELWDGNKILTV